MWPIESRKKRLLLLLIGMAGIGLVRAQDPSPTQVSSVSVELPAAGYVWLPELAPAGPLVIVISLPEQLAYVYRNGIRIGVSRTSTGKPGYETPVGIYSVLQKHREHYSNLYDDAPMPFMQRLTWTGVALHAGEVRAYPASHGCVRLPYAFAEKIFSATTQGTTVVIADAVSSAPSVAYPGLFAPVDPLTGQPRTIGAPLGDSQFVWMPELSLAGPLTVVLSTSDQVVVVMRNAVEIGRARVKLHGTVVKGTQLYVLLEGTRPGMSTVVPDRPALPWLSVPIDGAPPTARSGFAPGQLVVPQAFARQVYDLLVPGTTLIVTDQPVHAANGDSEIPVLRADRPAGVLPEKK